jgi:microcystin degradation protein MlrC
MKRRVVIAMLKHETNTFSPVPTDLARFGGAEICTGAEVYSQFKSTGTVMGSFLDVADAEGFEVATPLAATAAPSGPVNEDVYRNFCDAILEAIARGCDMCFLDLHGAMVTDSIEDGEGALLMRIRELARQLPIAVALDLHANLTDAMVGNCTAIVGYKTYPHTDMYETGVHVAQIVTRAMRKEIVPVMAWGNRPVLAQTLRMGHDDQPMHELIGAAIEEERRGLLAASVFGGFPLSDVWNAGVSVVTVADADHASAAAACDRLLGKAWKLRHEFVFQPEQLSQTIAKAKALRQGPILLLDHADNAASGGTQDTVTVLKEVLEQGLEDVAMFAICDPDAVQEMVKAGVGATVGLSLGGKMDMPAIGRPGEPLTVTGQVLAITDGDFVISAPMGRGTVKSMGPTAVFEIGSVQVVVISRNAEPFDLGCFLSVGIDPARKKYLILKSRIHYRMSFRKIARHELLCSGVGVTSSDNRLFEFRKVRRPIFPLDSDTPEYPDFGVEMRSAGHSREQEKGSNGSFDPCQ